MQVVLVERMQPIGLQVKSHIVRVETLIELNPYPIFAH